MSETATGDRIAKVIARAGLCSRRDAERWIGEGRVKVNGRVLTSPAVTVTPEDTVIVDGKPLPTAPSVRLWRYHKPAGLVTTHRDTRQRPTVFERLPADLGRVVSVGRLDLTSEGLLLLTNDGELARRLELPATGWTRRYRVRAFGPVDDAALASVERGITIDGMHYGPIQTRVDQKSGANTWLTVSLKEGKNREIRRVFEHLGLTVNRLIRIGYGPFQLGNLAPGEVAEVRGKVLREQLGRDVLK
ncbi:MAG: rRNA pseudouridine synthase [Rhodospirillales bacterium]|nr:rRNA pseudouridine synthase [Rhodospirillales bacterium]